MTPTQSALYEGLSNIDERFLHEAVTDQTNKTVWKQAAAMAATIVLIIGLFSIIPSVNASNGATPTLLDRYLSSFLPGYEPEPLFGDHPIFQFSVAPKNWQHEPGLLQKLYSLEVEYNGIVATESMYPGTDHIQVNLVSGKDNSFFSIIGWFDEPTYITISLIEKETQSVVQKQVVYINYLADEEKYETIVAEVSYYEGGNSNEE